MLRRLINLFAGNGSNAEVGKTAINSLSNFYGRTNQSIYKGFRYGISDLLQVTRKDLFCLTTRYFIDSQTASTEHTNFAPKSYLIPHHASEFRERYYAQNANGDAKDFIVKPGNESQGNGISLMSSASVLQLKGGAAVQNVVSEYVQNPYLLLGHKFDFRLYATVMRIQTQNNHIELRVYLHSEGLARFASQEYDIINRDNAFIHLTNYSLNSCASDFRENDLSVQSQSVSKLRGPTLTSHKWRASDVWEYLENDQGVDTAPIKNDIQRVVAASVAMAFIVPIPESVHAKNIQDTSHSTFELLGVDVIMDNLGNVHLLELQHKPSLLASSPLDAHVKVKVFSELQTLLEEQCPVKSGVICLSKDTSRFMKMYQRIRQAKGAETESLSILRKQIMSRNQEECYNTLLHSTAIQQIDY